MKTILTLLTFTLTSSATFAGMPTLTLTDIGRTRFSTLSFFLMVCLLSSFFVKLIWNAVRKDFPRLPVLSYKGAVAAVFLWGLVFVVVLTMISGARELMTPGAWRKNGLTYELDEPNPTNPESIAAEVSRQLNERAARTQQIQQLSGALQSFSQANGRFPTEAEFLEIPAETRTLPGSLGVEYLYRPPPSPAGEGDIVAFEPAVFDDQLALNAAGIVVPFAPGNDESAGQR